MTWLADLPTLVGQISISRFQNYCVCPDLVAKIFAVLFFGNHVSLPHPASVRGADASSRTRGGMRWTRAASVRRMMFAADGRAVWSWRPWAGAKSRRLATSALRARRAVTREATVTKGSRTPGRARRSLLTPSRREGRVAPVEPVVINSCAFLMHARLRVQPAPGLPCALVFPGGTSIRKPRANCAARTQTRISSWN
jgi:hypothetical protein